MATVVKFTLKDKNGCYAYYCNQSDDQSGEYVSLPDYRHDLANVQQELIAAQEEIRRLREALKPFAEYANTLGNYDHTDIIVTWRKGKAIQAQHFRTAREALK